ncbi:protein-disulfide reductase DsbD family protein [Alteromonas oceanisediminis]|uniref:protein-disulfide reductase DsbD family protein n=1 Tax=Alteromonas oceanisediminis TaxID=2836180 RepID=UPI001BD91389|nr:protein-disulfide reductase DsbD domain-containing protein [Alteromonas oceanisediminis]MBT0587385.1 thioredoxin family protein [Alteromonas oceanisediminis]
MSLVSEDQHWVAGSNAWIGIRLMPEAGWHTYWRNPGDSGEAPRVSLSSDAPLSFGDIQWPVPQAIPVAHLVNYGYEGENLLMIPVDVPATLSTDEVSVSAELSWLVCKEDCIPGNATLQLTLPVAASSSASAAALLFEKARQQLPDDKWLSGQLEINEASVAVEIALPAEMTSTTSSQWTLFPFPSNLIQHANPQYFTVDEGVLRSVIDKSPYWAGDVESINWLLSDGRQGFYVSTALAGQAHSGDAKASALALWDILGLAGMALLGGIILNLMPCVLPVLSIKALGLQQTQESKAVKLGFIKLGYPLGVLVSFNALAVTMLALQASGEKLGWGFQMQEPSIVILLSFLFTFIALVLFDALQVGTRLAGIGSHLIAGQGFGAQFFTGVLAVIVASPCTAPFMAAAIGVALVSEPAIVLVVFNALAIGFALPLTLLVFSQRLSQFLPKPGNWMVTFKHMLAFPMLATVAWLCWVYAGQTSHQAQFGLLLALITFSFSVWLSGRLHRAVPKWICASVALACLVLPMYLTAQLPDANQPARSITDNAVPFSKQALSSLIKQEQIVLVNMTADWCITCKVNEQVAFADADVRAALSAENVHYMVGDWTNKNDSILAYLNDYQRSGVPLYVVYSGTQSKQVLPQILTPSIVIDAINQATEEIPHE